MYAHKHKCICMHVGVIEKMHRMSWRTETKMKTGFIRGTIPIFIHIEKQQVDKATRLDAGVPSAILFNL